MPANKDLKERLLPNPVQMSAGPPPYEGPAPTPSQTRSRSPPPARKDWHARAQNNILISRNFGSIKKTRFTVDPNVQLSDSLLSPLQWEQPRYPSLSFKERPKPNIELAVTFGAIDAEINVLPLADSVMRKCRDANQCPSKTSSRSWSLLEPPPSCPRQSRVEVSTTTGDVALYVNTDASRTARISIRASSTLGQIAVYLPRTFHGPLTITSSSGTPRLSSGLQRVCAPISEVGGAKRWFVGDLDLWRARGEHADEALIGTTFGRVWVGYEGEEEEAGEALRWGAAQWVVHVVVALLSLSLLRLAVALLVWILLLVGLF